MNKQQIIDHLKTADVDGKFKEEIQNIILSDWTVVPDKYLNIIQYTIDTPNLDNAFLRQLENNRNQSLIVRFWVPCKYVDIWFRKNLMQGNRLINFHLGLLDNPRFMSFINNSNYLILPDVLKNALILQ